jgi:hypothetical protein
MNVQYDPMPQHGMHGGLDGGPQGSAAKNAILAGRIRVLRDASSGFRKIEGNKDLIMGGVCEPLARSLPILTEVFPVPAWTSSGLLPSRADSSSKEAMSESAVIDKKFQPDFYLTRFEEIIQLARSTLMKRSGAVRPRTHVSG